jgi:hypothetical protein
MRGQMMSNPAFKFDHVHIISNDPEASAYGALTSTPAGLSPAEHASLRWTHIRT